MAFKRWAIGTNGSKVCLENIPHTITQPPACTVVKRHDGSMFSFYLFIFLHALLFFFDPYRGSMAVDLASLRLWHWFLTSSLTCFIHIFVGSVRWTFHQAFRFRQRTLNSSLPSVIVQTWSKYCNHHFVICSSILGWCSHWQWIYSFPRWSQRKTCTIWCKHRI